MYKIFAGLHLYIQFLLTYSFKVTQLSDTSFDAFVYFIEQQAHVYCDNVVLEIIATADEKTAFTDIDAALLVGAMPRKAGMERKDLLAANVRIFKSQGSAMEKWAKKTCKVNLLLDPFCFLLL